MVITMLAEKEKPGKKRMETYPVQSCESDKGAVVGLMSACGFREGSQGCADTGVHWGGHLLGGFLQSCAVCGCLCVCYVCPRGCQGVRVSAWLQEGS